MQELKQQSLLSDTLINPKQVNAVTVKSGTQTKNLKCTELAKDQVGNLVEPSIKNEQDSNKKKDVEAISENKQYQEDYMPGRIVFADNPPPYVPKIPYPQRIRQIKNDEKFSKFLDMLKNLHINVPFVESLELVPKYAKFMRRF